MVNIIIAIIIGVIWLLVLGIATSKFLLFVSSQLVLVAFIFGNTCKTVFEAIVFLFVMHPFDVGDRCEIDGVQVFPFSHLFLAFLNPTPKSILCFLEPNVSFFPPSFSMTCSWLSKKWTSWQRCSYGSTTRRYTSQTVFSQPRRSTTSTEVRTWEMASSSAST